jgi:predicted metal-dependent hydrolase
MNKTQLEIDGITIEIVRKPIKNMHLRIYPPDGEVRVSAPLRASLRYIREQLEAKREWLHAQRARLMALPPKNELSMQQGESHYFLGQPYTLHITPTSASPHIQLEHNLLLFRIDPKATIIEKKAHLNQWYKIQMRALIPELIQKWQPIIGVKVAAWGIKTMKTRWGSCNTRAHRIWLNLVLIQKPLACLEYVLVHEMVHLLEPSHNKRFYALMTQFMPEWQNHKKLLQL